MDLNGFLKQNAVQAENIKFVASERFVDANNKPIEWEIRAITSKEDEDLRKNSMHKVPIVGKRNQFTQEIDTNKYMGLLAAACTAFPNLNDANLQDSYGVMSNDELLKAMLLPGEFADYLIKVQEICGFDKSMQDLVEEAKN
ncbi:phage portal protein [bacterium]|nr:phage portal protein [bacterium]